MFYERLNQLCHMHGTNMTDLAVNHLQLASSAPSSWKKGASPRAEVVVKAAQHFGVSADYLLGLTDLPLPPATAPAEPQLAQALVLLQEASPKAREAALAAAEAIIRTIDG